MTAKGRQSGPAKVRERYRHLFEGDGGRSQPMLHKLGTEIQDFGTMRLLPIALSHDARVRSCQDLNRILADTQILYSLYRNTTGSCEGSPSTNCTCCSTNMPASNSTSST